MYLIFNKTKYLLSGAEMGVTCKRKRTLRTTSHSHSNIHTEVPRICDDDPLRKSSLCLTSPTSYTGRSQQSRHYRCPPQRLLVTIISFLFLCAFVTATDAGKFFCCFF